MPKINHEEYEVLKGLDDKWKWIARDDDLSVYDDKPVKSHSIIPCWDIRTTKSEWQIINRSLFQFIQWEDEEPHNIAELIVEYESEETEVKKDKQWLEKELRNLEKLVKEALEASLIAKNEHYTEKNSNELQLLRRVFSLVNQLDEPEVLSQEWIDDNKKDSGVHYIGYYVPIGRLQNLLVPKQEEVDRAYKDGYEKGRELGFYKGYREGLANKGGEPETVADVVTTFWKSYERLKEVMNMEVEELEE